MIDANNDNLRMLRPNRPMAPYSVEEQIADLQMAVNQLTNEIELVAANLLTLVQALKRG